jgi:hypothetical protein
MATGIETKAPTASKVTTTALRARLSSFASKQQSRASSDEPSAVDYADFGEGHRYLSQDFLAMTILTSIKSVRTE